MEEGEGKEAPQQHYHSQVKEKGTMVTNAQMEVENNEMDPALILSYFEQILRKLSPKVNKISIEVAYLKCAPRGDWHALGHCSFARDLVMESLHENHIQQLSLMIRLFTMIYQLQLIGVIREIREEMADEV